MEIKKQNKRRLSERSHLTIEFPQSDNRVIRTFIPFLENPTVSEKGKANLNGYNLVGRAGQLFSYGGAESRKLSVNFHITLLHVMEEEKDLAEMFKSQFKLFFSESERARSSFELGAEMIETYKGAFDPGPLLWQPETANKTGEQRNHSSIHRRYYTELLKNVAGFDPSQEVGYTDTQLAKLTGGTVMEYPDPYTPGRVNAVYYTDHAAQVEVNRRTALKALDSTINLVYLWVNLIRASILNNSRSTTLGPPIVRLTHGGMYNNVPCLLQDYSINIVDEAGFDVQTMTPMRLEISLNLIESRTGNFGRFQAGQIELGDNLTGWESVIETNNIDPYNGLIGRGEPEWGVEV